MAKMRTLTIVMKMRDAHASLFFMLTPSSLGINIATRKAAKHIDNIIANFMAFSFVVSDYGPRSKEVGASVFMGTVICLQFERVKFTFIFGI